RLLEKKAETIIRQEPLPAVLDPKNIADRLEALGKRCDAVAVIAGDHPLIGQNIQSLKERGKPVVAYITDQSARDRAGFVGTDNWKLG
ncbi:LacI family transcriptional regulator, partial [Rhizobium leguminosarum]